MILAGPETTPVDPNRHIREYLTYYISLPYPPRYAILINGPWGIGKTFLVKKILSELGEIGRHVYVSLYGLRSVEEIDSALFAAIHPVAAAKGGRVAGKVVSAVVKSALRFDPDLKIDEVMNRLTDRLFVFDDLERCETPINTVMGYLNQFVEHDECRVLVIANEVEIPRDSQYAERREKLIGKTLEVQSAFGEALTNFIAQIADEPARSALEKRRADISSVYDQAGLYNLRILQQTMWDFERFFLALTEKHRQNEDALSHLLKFFFALSFEFKAGRIGISDLRSRLERIVSGRAARREDADPTLDLLLAATNRYPGINLHDTVISDDLLVDILAKGIMDGARIQESLDRSSYFVAKENETSWRTVWHWFERSDEEFQTAVRKMEEQFRAREFMTVGEMLHVFGLRLFLSDMEVLEKNRAEVVEDARHYIDDLYTKERLAVLPPDELNEIRFGGYGGLGIHEHETPEFLAIARYLRERQEMVTEDRLPAQAAKLLEQARAEPEEFSRQVCVTSSEAGRYSATPILAAIDPDGFVAMLLGLHPRRQRAVVSALRLRYENDRLDRDLPQERPWLEDVRDKLEQRATRMAPISKYRIQWQLENYINPILDAEEAP